MSTPAINRATRTDPYPPPPFFAVDELTLEEGFYYVTDEPRVTRVAPFFEDELLPLDEPFGFETED